MARPRRRADGVISLFPFLSVLVCAIGALIVIIGGQIRLAVGTSDQVIDVGGPARDKEPVYVECDGDGLLVHPGGERVPLESIGAASPVWRDLVQALSSSGGRRYLVLLVRPHGIAAYNLARRSAESHGISVGKDALLAGGKVVFSDQGRARVAPAREARP